MSTKRKHRAALDVREDGDEGAVLPSQNEGRWKAWSRFHPPVKLYHKLGVHCWHSCPCEVFAYRTRASQRLK
jgi:hypothetical protein